MCALPLLRDKVKPGETEQCGKPEGDWELEGTSDTVISSPLIQMCLCVKSRLRDAK